MERFSKTRSSWAATFIVSILVLAFVLPSVQNPLHFFQSAVLSVGNHSIRQSEFSRLLQQEKVMMILNGLEERDRSPYFLLEKIKRNALLSLECRALGMNTSHQAARDSLFHHPLFMDSKGQFQEKKLQDFLFQNQVTLVQLVEWEKNRLTRARLKKALLTQVHTPSVLSELAIRGLTQKRKGAYKVFSIQKESLPWIRPTEAELMALFEKEPIKAPEYRTYSFFRISLSSIELSPKEIESQAKEKISGMTDEEWKTKLRLEKARALLEQKMLQIEDGLGEGKSLEQLAQEHHCLLKTVTTDAQGKEENGKEAFPEEKKIQELLVQKAFSMGVTQNVELLPLSISSPEYLWIRIDKIDPPKTLSYNQAKKKLEQRLQEEGVRRHLVLQAQAFLANPVLSQMQIFGPITQGEVDGSVPSVVRNTLFRLRSGADGILAQDQKKIYGVKLLSITYDTPKEKEYLQQWVKRDWEKIFLESYLASLEKKYPVHWHFSVPQPEKRTPLGEESEGL